MWCHANNAFVWRLFSDFDAPAEPSVQDCFANGFEHFSYVKLVLEWFL